MQKYLYDLATDKNKNFFAGVIKVFLFLLSLLYGLIVLLLIFIYRFKPCRLKCRVISVGNITLGGTGKTALVELIASCLKSKGYKVAILSRGYKRKVASRKSQVASHEAMGDEPYMLKTQLKDIPVLVDSCRCRSGWLAINNYAADTVILDDGFQQWKIKKDLEIVTVDAANPFGNRKLLPRGILRQPVSTLKKADVFVLTKTDLHKDTQSLRSFLQRINPAALIFESMHKPTGFYRIREGQAQLGADIFKGKKVALVCGIADPGYFESTIKSLSIDIGLSFRFPDHHQYCRKDLEDVFKKSAQQNIGTILTTQKDAAKIISVLPDDDLADVFVLRVKLEIIKDEQIFYHRLLKLYSL